MQKFFVTIKCPYCKNTQQKSLKKWKFGDFDVDRLQCKSCKNESYLVSHEKKICQNQRCGATL